MAERIESLKAGILAGFCLIIAFFLTTLVNNLVLATNFEQFALPLVQNGCNLPSPWRTNVMPVTHQFSKLEANCPTIAVPPLGTISLQ